MSTLYISRFLYDTIALLATFASTSNFSTQSERKLLHVPRPVIISIGHKWTVQSRDRALSQRHKALGSVISLVAWHVSVSQRPGNLELTSHNTQVVAKNWSISSFNFSTLTWSRESCATIPLLLVPFLPLIPPPTALTAEAKTSGMISSRSLSPAAISFLLPPSSRFEGSNAETIASPLGRTAYEDDNKVRGFELASADGFMGFANRTSSSCR